MAKKKEVKKVVKTSNKITDYDSAKAHVNRAGVKSDGFEVCYVCEDGNIFTHEGNCMAHARRTKQPYYAIQL